MEKINIKHYALILLLVLGKVSFAQVEFNQTFKNPQVLQMSGWETYLSRDGITRSSADKDEPTNTGSLKISFYAQAAGTIDSLKTPEFTPTINGDSLFFDHAHVMRAFSSGQDSMDIMYSTDGGATFTFLSRYIADYMVTATSLSTVPKPTSNTGSEFVPTRSSQWISKSIELPIGTNRLAFIFYASGGDNLYLDNIVVGAPLSFCTGSPFISTISGTQVLCSGKEFFIGPDTFDYNSAVTYQWQESADDGVLIPWSDITTGIGYNTAEFIGNHVSSTYYRLAATCNNTTLITYSGSIHFVNDSTYNCLCSANLGGSCNGFMPSISNVTFPGKTLNNTSTCNLSNSSAYSFFGFGPTFDTITAGDPNAQVDITHDNTEANVYAWIDYNHNGSFEKEEYYLLGNNMPYSISNRYSFSVPLNALSGITGMRIRTTVNWGTPLDSSDACANVFSAGETEDYLVYINPAPVCAGTPVAGTLNYVNYTACAGTKVSLRALGTTFGNGITYQWEESDDNGVTDVWTSVLSGSGMNTIAFKPDPITDTIYYRLKVMCANTNDSVYSTEVGIYTQPIYLCYCQAGLGGGIGAACASYNPYISYVGITGSTLDNSSSCPTNSDNYTYLGISANTTDTVYRGGEVTLNVQTEVTSNIVAAWIDYNQNAVFEDNEYIEVSPFTNPGQMDSVKFTIPNNGSVLIGYTGLRIRTTNFNNGTIAAYNACSAYDLGETEDYVIYIDDAPACSGIPVAGFFSSDTLMVCAGDSAMIEVLGASYGSGVQYTWQQSLDAGVTDPWTVVSTGSGFDSRSFHSDPVADTIFYRLKVTCTNSSVDTYGNALMVALNPYYKCYCTNDLGGGRGISCNSGTYINNVSIVGGGLNNGSDCHIDPVKSNYQIFEPIGTATDTLLLGGIYNLSVSTAGNGQSVVAWIDFDHNGVFDNNEYQLITSNSDARTPAIVRIALPVNVDTGYVGVRVRTSENLILGPGDACTFIFTSGETEDYALYIKEAPVCNGLPDAGDIGRDMLTCANVVFEMEAPEASFGEGISYQWEESDDNGVTDPWEPAVNAVLGSDTTRFVMINGITADKYYRFKDSCAISNLVNYSVSKYVGIDSFYNCYTQTADFGGDCSAHIENVSIAGTTMNNTSSCNTTAANGVYSKFTPVGAATATVLRGNDYDVTVLPSNTNSQNVGLWIDYNRNGHFETNEFTNIGTGSSRGAPSASINIKAYSGLGYTGMRIRSVFTGITMTNVQPGDTTMTYFGPGETEDYVIYIDTLAPASNVFTSDETDNSIDINWTRGNGDGVIVIAKDPTTTLVSPANGTEYRWDFSWANFGGDSTGTGNYVVYNGPANTTTLLDLDMLTTYDFYVYEYIYTGTGRGRSIIYHATPAFSNGTTTPVKLISFTATALSNNALLNWSTASEQNNAGFEVERSYDGKNFDKAGFVSGNGTSNITNAYSFTDFSVFTKQTALAYYRLKQLDNNGNYTYSSTIPVSSTKLDEAMIAYPNPFTNALSFKINNEWVGQTATIEVYDMLGSHVRTKNTILDKLGVVSIDHLDDLTKGIYLIKVQVEGVTQTYKMMKEQ